nr:hypothetical protein [Tanacetum cinerariifolium]
VTAATTQVVPTAKPAVVVVSTPISAANPAAKPKSKEEMEKEEEDIIKSINETPAQKAAKRRRLHRCTRCYMEKSIDCTWTSFGKKLEAVNFVWLELKLFRDAVVVAHMK